MSAERHPAVVYLTAALNQAEQTAQQAQGTWTGVARGGGRLSIVDEQGRYVAHLPNRLTAHDPQGDYAAATLIETNDPASVLRRIAADRKTFAEHQVHECGDVDGCALEPGHQRAFCNQCRPGVLWPCPTVLHLAEGWGWNPDSPETGPELALQVDTGGPASS